MLVKAPLIMDIIAGRENSIKYACLFACTINVISWGCACWLKSSQYNSKSKWVRKFKILFTDLIWLTLWA